MTPGLCFDPNHGGDGDVGDRQAIDMLGECRS
jgi:hypothetical protein